MVRSLWTPEVLPKPTPQPEHVAHDDMAKDKSEKKEKRKLKEVGDEDEAGDISMLSVDADAVDGARVCAFRLRFPS